MAGERPAIHGGVIVDRLPDSAGLLLRGGGGFAFPTTRPGRGGFVPAAPTAGLGAAALKQSSPSRFSDLLLERMRLEVNRLDPRERDDMRQTAPAWAAYEDSRIEQLKAAHAERILTRAFDKALDIQLEQFARTTGGLGDAWSWVENLGTRTRSATGFGSPGRRDDAGGDSTAPRFAGGIGFKVAAHPRMILHTELFKIQGRIDVPLRNEPITVTIERQLGSRAHVALTGGLARGESDDWMNLSLRLGF